MFSLTLPLLKIEKDLSSSINSAEDVIKTLQSFRATTEEAQEGVKNDVKELSKHFKKAEKLLKDHFDVEISVLRQASHQTHREKYVPHSTPEDFYRKRIFIPCINTLISGLKYMFSANKPLLEGFNSLLPKNVNRSKVEKLRHLKLY